MGLFRLRVYLNVFVRISLLSIAGGCNPVLDIIVFDKIRLLGSAESGHVMDMFDIGRFYFICVVERLWFGFEVKWGWIKAGLAK